MSAAGAPLLRALELGHRYPGSSTPALRGLSFSVAPGERLGLVGANGAGKSTLLLLLAGLLRGQGSVWLGETEHRGRGLEGLRGRVGLVFQDSDDQLFMPSVREDVAFGPQNRGLRGAALDQRVGSALRQLGIEALAERSPQQLSPGQKRRVAVAGVLAMEPDLLLFDEPSAALDPPGQAQVEALMASLPSALLLSSHDLELVRRLCPRCLVLAQGELLAEGPSAQLLSDPALLARAGLLRNA